MPHQINPLHTPEKSIYYKIIKKRNIAYDKSSICLYAPISSCNRKAINSHSIPVSALRMIAQQEHVLTFDKLEYKDFKSVLSCEIQPCLIGINKASTFLGFCDIDDSDIFSYIERQNTIIPNREQLLLFHFRAVAYHYWYTKQAPKGFVAMAKEAHKNGIAFDSYQQYADDIENNCIPLIEQYFNCLRSSIASKDYSDYKSLFFRLEKLPEFFCCVLGFPFFDFDKNALSFSFLPLSIVVSADSRSGYMALTWNRMATHIDSFISSWQRHNYNFNFMLSFIFSCEHNYYFSPQWWMALTYEKQKRITEFAMLPYRIEVCKQFNTSLRDLFYGIYEKFSDEKMIFSGVTTGSPVEI